MFFKREFVKTTFLWNEVVSFLRMRTRYFVTVLKALMRMALQNLFVTTGQAISAEKFCKYIKDLFSKD